MSNASSVKYYIVTERDNQTALQRFAAMTIEPNSFYIVGTDFYLGSRKLNNIDDIATAIGTIPTDEVTNQPVAENVVQYIQTILAANGTGVGDPSDSTSYAGRLTAAENAITLLNNNNTVSGSVDYKIKTAIDNILNGAPATYDTLKEISDWISTHGTEAATMASSISDLETRVGTLESGLVWEEI